MEKLPKYKTEKFEWDGDATAPKGYSMIIVSPNYFRLEGIKLAFIPDMSSMEDGWGGFYSGTSYLPIGLGQIFTIQNKTIEHELVAIEVIHHS